VDKSSERSLPEVLYAEDDVLVSESLVASLEEAGYKVLLATNGTDALVKLNELSASLVAFITDVNLGSGPDGWELGHSARELNPALPARVVNRRRSGRVTACRIASSSASPSRRHRSSSLSPHC
jgi:CheY-like chemotaxis protein